MSKTAKERLAAKAAVTSPLEALRALVKALSDPDAVLPFGDYVSYSLDFCEAVELARAVLQPGPSPDRMELERLRRDLEKLRAYMEERRVAAISPFAAGEAFHAVGRIDDILRGGS